VFPLRNIQLSVHKRLTDLFTAPPNNPDTGLPYIATAYNVYNEDNYQQDTFTPTFPFVFLLMVRVPPKKTRLPCILMDVSEFSSAPYELGTRRGMISTINLHIFGKNRGERDELAGFLRQAMTDYPGLTIYDWTNIARPVSKYVASVEDITVAPQSIGNELATEGSLTNWNTLTFTLLLKE